MDYSLHANEVPFSTFRLSAAYLTRGLAGRCGPRVIAPLRSVMDLTNDAFAHQHLRPPRLAGRDCLIDPMMIVTAATDVAMLEGNDVLARRHRHMVADTDHLGLGHKSILGMTTDPRKRLR
jgi:hypothetical protein